MVGEKGEEDDEEAEKERGRSRAKKETGGSERAITQQSLRSFLRNNYDNASVNSRLRDLHLWKGELVGGVDHAPEIPSCFAMLIIRVIALAFFVRHRLRVNRSGNVSLTDRLRSIENALRWKTMSLFHLLFSLFS